MASDNEEKHALQNPTGSDQQNGFRGADQKTGTKAAFLAQIGANSLSQFDRDDGTSYKQGTNRRKCNPAPCSELKAEFGTIWLGSRISNRLLMIFV